jgi:4'-phosphopantetheinyl transferase
MAIDPPPIALSRADIHLWLTGDRVDAETAARCRNIMNPDEKQREVQFHFEKDRARHVATRALVRTVLSRYEAVDPADWVFSTNAYGRPDVDASMTRGHDLSFNVSHTAGLIVLGVTRDRALGVDVEKLHSVEDMLGLAKYAFAPTEVAELLQLPAERRLDRFFQHWTFKEAYIKARGMGVSIPLQGFGMQLTQDCVAKLDIAPELADRSSRWQFWQIRPSPDHVLAICAERIGQPSTAIVARRVVLLDSEEIIPVEFDRTSP